MKYKLLASRAALQLDRPQEIHIKRKSRAPRNKHEAQAVHQHGLKECRGPQLVYRHERNYSHRLSWNMISSHGGGGAGVPKPEPVFLGAAPPTLPIRLGPDGALPDSAEPDAALARGCGAAAETLLAKLPKRLRDPLST